MNLIKFLPFILFILGVILLVYIGQPVIAGACFLIGIVMILERIWPEEWEADKSN